MNILQITLIALLGYLTHIHVPFLGGGLLGWYCIGRPLVSSFFIGIILGDVTTAIRLGVYIQLIFIGLVTPGGSISPDMNLATYVALPLAVTGGLDSGATVALAVTVSQLGTLMSQPCNALMIAWPLNTMKRLLAAGKLKETTLVPVWGNVVKFIFRFIPIFFSLLFGQTAVATIMEVTPQWLLNIFTVFGGPMCLVGFSILMKILVKNTTDLIYFAVGFALVSVFKADMVTVLVFGLLCALLEFKIGRARKGASV